MGHIAFSFQLPFIMLINGETFEGTYEYECTDSRLKNILVLLMHLASLNLDLSCFPMPE